MKSTLHARLCHGRRRCYRKHRMSVCLVPASLSISVESLTLSKRRTPGGLTINPFLHVAKLFPQEQALDRFAREYRFRDRPNRHSLLSDDLHQDALAPASVELSVKNLLPRSEIQTPVRNRHHHF